jgi:hypothetical protein
MFHTPLRVIKEKCEDAQARVAPLSARRAAGPFESQRPLRQQAQICAAIAGGPQACQLCIEASGALRELLSKQCGDPTGSRL